MNERPSASVPVRGLSAAADTWPMSAREAATALGVSERTIRRAIARGALAAMRHAGVYRIAQGELANYRGRNPAPPPALSQPQATVAGAAPRPRTPLIGRVREVTAVLELLLRDDVPILTLTGPGGVGKTRLALQVAAEASDSFADGVAFVPLAPIQSIDLVAPTIAQVLGLREAGEQPLYERLKAFLRTKYLLLVLDNFEQVVEAAPLVADLLAACPRLTALVTSRTRLRITGERVWPVPPMGLPELNTTPSAELATAFDAVRLFVERAQAVEPGFMATESNAPTLAAICRRLDGLPLAIELAATRSNLLPPDALLARLDKRLPLLTAGGREQPSRLRTMRAAIAWSYDLLSATEQALFRRLSAFVDGFTLEAAQAVTAELEDPGADLLDGIGSLLDQSLLQRVAAPGPVPRYELLETVREYGLEQLDASGEASQVRRQHAFYFLGVAEAAAPKLRERGQGAWLARLEKEHNNLRAAIAWLLDQREVDKVLRLTCALHWFWYLRGHWSEGRRWLGGALALQRPAPSVAQARALAGAGILAFHQGDQDVARTQLQEAVTVGRVLGDTGCTAYGLHFREMAVLYLGDAAAPASLAESVALFRVAGDGWGLAVALCSQAVDAIQRGDRSASSLIAESLALAREQGDAWALARTLHYAGEAARSSGNYDLAGALYQESLGLNRELGYRDGMARALHNLGYVALHHGDLRRAGACFSESLELFREQGVARHLAYCLLGLADVVCNAGHSEQAVRVATAGMHLLEATTALVWPVDRVEWERSVGAMRTRCGDVRFTEAWAAGQTLALDEAVAEAAAALAEQPTAPLAPARPLDPTRAGGLTARELEVLSLLAVGRTNAEIASSLVIGRRTVTTHIEHIFAKLGVRTRTEAAAQALMRADAEIGT